MKVYRFSLIISIALLLPNLVTLTGAGSRKKRVILGLEAWESTRDFYLSFRYYVFLAKAPYGTTVDENPDTYRFWKVTRWFKKIGAKVEWHHCGGSLITPNVVQTACHCLAYFPQRPKNNNYHFSHARAMNIWEDRIYSYVGANQIENMPLTMLVPKYYVIYEQCRKFIHHLQFSVMDFGLIITEDSIVKRLPTANISYAPVYKAADILKYYYKNIQVERMCLVIGHGQWNVPYSAESELLIDGSSSEVQRWGWRTIMSSVDCMAATFKLIDRRIIMKEYHAYFDYAKESTWVCLQHSSKFSKRWVYNYGRGDSGGPVACDIAYFAVNSMKQDEYAMAGPIAHTTFENAAEFRDNFMSWIDRFGTDKGDSVNHITDRIFVPTPEIYRFSRSSIRTIEILPPLFSTLFLTTMSFLFFNT